MREDPTPLTDGAARLARSRADIARWLDAAGLADPAGAPTLPEQAARALLSSAARHHPWGLMAGAAATGATLAWFRPWRRPLGPTLLGSVAAPLLAELAAQLLHRTPGPGPRRPDTPGPSIPHPREP